MLETDQIAEQEKDLLRKILLGQIEGPKETTQMVINEEPLPVDRHIAVMEGVESRLEKANCYRLLLNDSIFQGELSPIAQEVQDEIREYIVHRLEVLLGIAAERDSKLFSDEEITALKTLAGTLLARPRVLSKVAPTLPPRIVAKPPLSLRKVAPQQAPKLEVRQVIEPEPQYAPEPTYPEPVSVQVVEQPKRRGGRPKKVIKSPKTIITKDGKEIRPDISMEHQVKPGPTAQQPARMPSQAAQNMMAAQDAANNMGGAAGVNPFMAAAMQNVLIKGGGQ